LTTSGEGGTLKAPYDREITPHEASLLHDMNGPELISALYEEYNDRLHHYIRRLMDPDEDADDVAHEVYLRLIRHRKNHDLKPSFALIRTIATNILTDRFRKRRSQSADKHIPLEKVDLVSPQSSPEEIAWSREALGMIKTVFDGLSKKTREAFVLHRFGGLTYEQIAEEMGISRSMVQRHISSVLLELDDKFEKEK
jgi:RNA polymerase sigma factor (sigma-70 family)